MEGCGRHVRLSPLRIETARNNHEVEHVENRTFSTPSTREEGAVTHAIFFISIEDAGRNIRPFRQHFRRKVRLASLPENRGKGKKRWCSFPFSQREHNRAARGVRQPRIYSISLEIP